MTEPRNLLGKTVQYTTMTPKGGTRVVRGVIADVSEVPDQEPWFLVVEEFGERVKIPVWYAVSWVTDWKVLD